MKQLNSRICIAGKEIRIFDLVSCVLAALGYGGWAFFANFDTSASAAWRASILQGCYAFGSTLLLNTAVRTISRKLGGGPRGKTIAYICGLIIIVSIPLAIHSVAQTPNILLTIAPGVIWGSIYVGIYMYFLE